MSELEHPKGCPPVRTYLRHKNTGDLALEVVYSEKVKMNHNLPGFPLYYTATQLYNWLFETKAKELPPGSYARIAYEADRVLCDIHPELKRQPEWLSLDTRKKAAWIEARVSFDNPTRQELYNAIIGALEGKKNA